jgi:hypothetical protein
MSHRVPDAVLEHGEFERSAGVASIDASTRSQRDEADSLCHALFRTVQAHGPPDDAEDVPSEQTPREVLEVVHGPMADQFTPLFFSVAYCFLFPHGNLGLPDMEYSFSTRPHREGGAPRVEFTELYAKLLVQRAEATFRRDLTLSFALWQMVFRTKVNLGRHFYAAMREATRYAGDGEHKYTYDDVLDATTEILTGLTGEYRTNQFTTVKVRGNLALLRGNPNLSPLAQSLIRSYTIGASDVEGTQEVRSKLRSLVMAYRVRYGSHHMLTLSPNPQHSLLMIRLSRTMESDPIKITDKDLHAWGRRDVPSIVTAFDYAEDCDDGSCSAPNVDGDAAYIAVPIAPFLDQVPDLAVRRRILAKDPLAQVYGFRMIVQVLLRAMLGVRVCSDCPRCCESEFPCMDSFGAVHEPEGGILGLVEAYAGAVEYQSGPGALHLHLLLFLKSTFQHRTPKEVLDHMGGRLHDFVTELENFKRHAANESYPLGAPNDEVVARIEALGRSGHANEALLLCRPRSNEARSGADYVAACRRDTQCVALHTMHHTHPLCEETSERRPLPACERVGVPGICKRGFPHEERMCDKGVLLCHGLIHDRGLNCKPNYKNLVGSLVGPRNHEYLCDSPHALLRVARFNVNLVIEHRLPPICELHSAECQQAECHAYFSCRCAACAASCRNWDEEAARAVEDEIARMFERLMATMGAYISNYCAKAQPMPIKHINTYQAGHTHLTNKAKRERWTMGYTAKRCVSRLLSDLQQKSIMRKHPEIINLLINRHPYDITAAESFKSAPTVFMHCAKYVHAVLRTMSDPGSASAVQTGHSTSAVQADHQDDCGEVEGVCDPEQVLSPSFIHPIPESPSQTPLHLWHRFAWACVSVGCVRARARACV